MSEKEHHSKHYCYRYTFSSKIECGICDSNYVHRISGNQKGKKYFYWSCYNKVTLKDDEYFILGDNRLISKDSRYFGPIKDNEIKGKIVFRLFPFTKIGTVQ